MWGHRTVYYNLLCAQIFFFFLITPPSLGICTFRRLLCWRSLIFFTYSTVLKMFMFAGARSSFLGLSHAGGNKFAGWVYTLLYLSACKIMPGSGQFIIKILHEHKNKNKHAAAILDLPWILLRPFKHLSALKISWDYP